MPLAIFDIDGTLTDTVAVDAECLETALREVLKVAELPDWRSLDDVTDASILRLVWKKLGRGPLPEHAERKVVARFVEILNEAHLHDRARFGPLAGAQTVLERVKVLGGHPGIATGGWRASAELKLALAGIRYDGVHVATSTERTSRKEILAFALAHARQESGDDGPAVYFGDAPWDARAAASLSIPFVGIGSGEAATALSELGALRVLPDFADAAAFIDVLEEAWAA